MSARILVSLLFTININIVFAQTSSHLLIGTYTSGKSEGIYVYDFNTTTGENHQVSTIKTSNPSYLAVSPDQKMVYAVAENADSTRMGFQGSVAAFSFDKTTGSLSFVNKQFSGGKHPCYVAIDQSGKWVFAANYSSGSAAILPVNKDGSLAPAKQVMQDSGNGPDKNRQDGPHVHSTVLSPDNKFLFTPDLGTDKIMIYRFDNINGTLSDANPPFVQSVPGSGPRHFEFHPKKPYAYLMEEMTGTVVAYKYKNGKLDSIQRISALPTGFKGIIGSADIHVSPDGKYLYCSNRGESNSIAIFSVNRKNGQLKAVGHQSSLGIMPRNFNFDPTGNFLLVAHQKSDDIVIFKIDKQTGLLTDTGKRINVPNPVCIKWID